MTEGLSLGFLVRRDRWPVEIGPNTFSRMYPPRKTAGSRVSMDLIAWARASGVLCFGGTVDNCPICMQCVVLLYICCGVQELYNIVVNYSPICNIIATTYM